jgi:hypothetical protein
MPVADGAETGYPNNPWPDGGSSCVWSGSKRGGSRPRISCRQNQVFFPHPADAPVLTLPWGPGNRRRGASGVAGPRWPTSRDWNIELSKKLTGNRLQPEVDNMRPSLRMASGIRISDRLHRKQHKAVHIDGPYRVTEGHLVASVKDYGAAVATCRKLSPPELIGYLQPAGRKPLLFLS